MADKGTTPYPGSATDFQNVQVSIDDDYACTIYTSCKQTSFIAAAGLSSSVGFLNFLGYNGAAYSKSFITFVTDNTGQTSGYLNSEAEPCEWQVPEDGLLFGYKVEDSTCSFCAKACPPPVVDDKIGFLDGLSWKLVGYSYLGFVLFSIIFQVLMHCWLKKRKLAKARAEAIANQTASTQDASLQTNPQNNSSSHLGKQGRPLNITDDNTSSMDFS